MATRTTYQPPPFDGPARYRIVVEGLVAHNLSERMEGMVIEQEEAAGTALSTLTGKLEDQAALASVLSTLYDLHFTLLSVEQIPPGDANEPFADRNPIA